MKILGIDGSGLVASVAIVEDDNLVGEYTTGYKKTHSQTLLPMLDELGKMVELDLNTIDAIAVAAGPGSFTGLRIASATAKGLGLSLGCPIISVPTVDALAFNLWGHETLICPIMAKEIWDFWFFPCFRYEFQEVTSYINRFSADATHIPNQFTRIVPIRFYLHHLKVPWFLSLKFL